MTPCELPAGGGEQADQAEGNGRAARRRVGQRLECQREQRVADEDGGRLTVDDVAGGLAAAQLGVVEAGQIVLHQGGAVDELDGGGEAADHFVVAAAVPVGDEAAEQRARAAATGEDRVVHGAVQTGGRRVASRKRA